MQAKLDQLTDDKAKSDELVEAAFAGKRRADEAAALARAEVMMIPSTATVHYRTPRHAAPFTCLTERLPVRAQAARVADASKSATSNLAMAQVRARHTRARWLACVDVVIATRPQECQ